MSTQFIACTDSTCPMNEDKQCRSPFIMVDEEGFCSLRKTSGPFDAKSLTENYVDLRECKCYGCDHWELDEATGYGVCGLHEDLFFSIRQMANGDAFPKCMAFDKQIDPPKFTATI